VKSAAVTAANAPARAKMVMPQRGGLVVGSTMRCRSPGNTANRFTLKRSPGGRAFAWHARAFDVVRS
jgi:hypothetical protein